MKLFVLVAAEGIRRHYQGGRWNWDLVRQVTGMKFDDSEGRLWTDQGLRAWGRKIRRGQANDHLYLMSLVCEGGISTWIIAQPGTAMQDWCRAIFSDLRSMGWKGDESSEELTMVASRCALSRGQSYFRDQSIHSLFGELVGRIWNLRQRLGEFPAQNILPWLDKVAPGWREQLPLDISDQHTDRLLASLLAEAEQQAQPSARPSVRTWLTDTGISRLVVIPALLKSDIMQELFGEFRSGSRIGLMAHQGRRRQIAATLLRETNGWRVQSRSCVWEDSGPISLELEGVYGTVPKVVIAGELPDIPWVFAPDGELWRMVGVGTVSHPLHALTVLLPAGWTPNGTEERAGRSMLRIKSSVTFSNGSEQCTVRPLHTQNNNDLEMVFDGQKCPHGEDDIWLGLPTVFAMREDGTRRKLTEANLEVRLKRNGAWKPWGTLLNGDLDVRYIQGGHLRLKGRCKVAPADLSITVSSQNNTSGRITSTGRGVVGLGILGNMVGFTIQNNQGALDFQVTGEPPLNVRLRLLLQNGSELVLRVPFPLDRDEFYGRDGLPIPANSRQSSEKLGGIIAEARCLRERPILTASLRHPKLHHPEEQIFNLRETVRGVWQLDLRQIQESLVEMFALTDELDAEICLQLSRLGVRQVSRPLVLHRYARELVLNKDAKYAKLDEMIDEDHEVTMEIRRFDDFQNSKKMTRVKPDLHWLFEETVPGAYLLSASDVGGLVARPVAWSIRQPAAIMPQSNSSLIATFQIGHPMERFTAIGKVFERMQSSSINEDWETLMTHVHSLNWLDGTALDTVRALTRYPLMTARIVLECPEEIATHFFQAMNRLPFLWETVPLSAWRSALDHLYAEMVKDWEPTHKRFWTMFQMSVTPVASQVSTLELVLIPWLKVHGGPTLTSPLLFLRNNPVLLQSHLKSVVNDLLLRHTEVQWPTVYPNNILDSFPRISGFRPPTADLPVHTHATILAPFIAAACSVQGLALHENQIRLLRRLRSFDHLYFEEAWPLAAAYLNPVNP